MKTSTGQLRKPRPQRWRLQVIRQMYLEQFPSWVSRPVDLDQKARIITRELNRLDDRTRYRDWRFKMYELPSGSRVGELDNPTSWQLNCA